MKDKFEEAILAKLLNYGHEVPRDEYEVLATDAAISCNISHQQALKDIFKQLLKANKNWISYYGILNEIKQIAKENNIDL